MPATLRLGPTSNCLPAFCPHPSPSTPPTDPTPLAIAPAAQPHLNPSQPHLNRISTASQPEAGPCVAGGERRLSPRHPAPRPLHRRHSPLRPLLLQPLTRDGRRAAGAALVAGVGAGRRLRLADAPPLVTRDTDARQAATGLLRPQSTPPPPPPPPTYLYRAVQVQGYPTTPPRPPSSRLRGRGLLPPTVPPP